MPPSDTVVQRKPRATGFSKFFRKYGKKFLFQWSIPIVRYSLLPGMVFYSMYYTEPEPTLSDLFNPFF